LERFVYGADPSQFAQLRLPAGNERHPVAVVIHGGFWRAKYDLEHIVPVCEALTAAGLATWNLEYRRLGNGGGFPHTLHDVAAGADYLLTLASQYNIDMNRVIAIGHSSGGHLAFSLAAHTRELKLRGVISLAGVLDLQRAWELRLSNNAAAEFLGGSPAEFPERYSSASPIERLPYGIPQKLFHGTDDASVPLEISERFAAAARERGDEVELTILRGSGHFEVVQPETQEFALVVQAALQLAR
jgi:acetyl esterase/lipase